MAKFIEKDMGYNNLVKELKNLKGIALVGVFFDKKNKEGVSIAEYGIYNEFGTTHIPERSFMRSSYYENIIKIRKSMMKYAQKNIFKKNISKNMLSVAGAMMSDAIKKKITDSKNWAEPNSMKTIISKTKSRARTKDQPLINTGALRSAITWKIYI